MKPNVLKTVLQTVLHFIDTRKHIDLQNDTGTDLDLFLSEFNRYRLMLGLTPYKLDRRMPMTGRGDWSGRGEKVRFVEDKPSAVTPKKATPKKEAPRKVAAKPKTKTKTTTKSSAELGRAKTSNKAKTKKAKTTQEEVVKTNTTTSTATLQINVVPPTKRITKTKLAEKLMSVYQNIEIKELRQDSKTSTLYFSEGQQVGFWRKGRGWAK